MTRSRRLISRTALAAALAGTMALALPVAGPALADAPAAARSVPQAELVGKGRYTVFGFRVFDAALYAPGGQYSEARPFALQLTYLRSFKGAKIAEKTVSEMRRQGMKSGAKLDGWLAEMNRIFPNVSSGDTLTGVRTASGATEFYSGTRKIGTISDPEFAQRFFRIWLGSNTDDPRLRNKLIGKGA